MTARSTQIETRFGITLSKDLREWFDDELYREELDGEFCEPLSAEEFLDPSPVALWPGFQLPNTLPLIGNGYGDWLCVRIAKNSMVEDIVRWRHAGGDWIPCGKSLAAAVCFEQVIAGNAETYTEIAKSPKIHDWLRRNLGPTVDSFSRKVTRKVTGEETDEPREMLAKLRLLAGANIALQSSLRGICFTLLKRPLCAYPEAELEAGIGHQQDTQPPPPDEESRLATLIDDLDQPDRDLLAVSAKSAARANHDIAWPHYISAVLAELADEPMAACGDYGRALTASAFTDEATDLGLHKFPESFGKFAAYRISKLAEKTDAVSHATLGIETVSREYLSILLSEQADVFRAVALFHRGRAQAATLPADRYNALFDCGWDLGLDGLDAYGELLKELADAAAEAGQIGRSKIADLHAQRLN